MKLLLRSVLLGVSLWQTVVAVAVVNAAETGALPGPLISPSPSPQPGSRVVQDSAARVMELVNQERWDNGQLPPLKRHELLDAAAETHSANMAMRDFFAHCDLDTGTLPWDRMDEAGYTDWNAAAENIAGGQNTPEAVMAAWMNSSGHRFNILSTSTREIGIGYFYQSSDASGVRRDNDGDCVSDGSTPWPLYHYWTQNFARRNHVYPIVIDREHAQTDTRTVDLYLYGSGLATQMRLRNENGAWTAWQPFSAEVEWQLSAGNGIKEVQAEIRNDAGTVRSASDTIVLDAPEIAESVPDSLGVFEPSTGRWYLDDGDGVWNGCDVELCLGPFGITGDQAVVGDWQGTGSVQIGIFRPGTGRWYLDNGDGVWSGCDIDQCLGPFGGPNDQAVAGDWNGNGTTQIGVFRAAAGRWYLDDGDGVWSSCDNESCLGPFGGSLDQAVVGDWNGDGVTQVGVFRAVVKRWYLDDGDGVWSSCDNEGCLGPFGGSGDLPVAGDWDADDAGLDEFGIFHAATGWWYLDNGNGVWDDCDIEYCIASPAVDENNLPVVGQW